MKKKLDFTGVETFQRAPEGKHIAKINKIDETTFQGGNEGFKVTFEIVKGVGKGCRVIENFPFVDTALWKLKNLLESIGMRANGRVMVDTDKLIGKLVEITVNHEEYEGRTRAKVAEINKIINTSDDEDDADDEDNEEPEDTEEVEDEDEDEEEPPKKSAKIAPKAKEKAKADKSTKTDKKSAKKAKSEPEEDEDDDWSDDDDWDEEE